MSNIQHSSKSEGWMTPTLQTTQNKEVPAIGEFSYCVPARRISFIDPNTGKPGNAPTHSNCIVYVPGKLDATTLFIETFSKLGTTR
jgi:hypothetical protein